MIMVKELTLKAKLALFKKVGIMDANKKNNGIGEFYRGDGDYFTFRGVTYTHVSGKALHSADVLSDSFIRKWDPETEKVLATPSGGYYSKSESPHPWNRPQQVFWLLKALTRKEKKAIPKLAGGKWKDLDYWIWCLFTLDDEETRLEEEPDEVVSDFLKAGGPKSQVPKIYKMIRTMTRSDLSTDKLLNLLKPYASHQSLMKAGTWEEQYNMHMDKEDE